MDTSFPFPPVAAYKDPNQQFYQLHLVQDLLFSYTVDDFFLIFDAMRDMLQSELESLLPDDKIKFIARLTHQVNARLWVIFNDTTVNSHELRKLYSQWAYIKYADTGVSEAYYIMDVLGHSNFRSAEYYTVVGLCIIKGQHVCSHSKIGHQYKFLLGTHKVGMSFKDYINS